MIWFIVPVLTTFFVVFALIVWWQVVLAWLLVWALAVMFAYGLVLLGEKSSAKKSKL